MEKTFKVTRRWQGNRLTIFVAFAIYIPERMSLFGLIYCNARFYINHALSCSALRIYHYI